MYLLILNRAWEINTMPCLLFEFSNPQINPIRKISLNATIN